MRKRFALALVALAGCTAGSPPSATSPSPSTGDDAFRALERRYVVEFLRRNPTVNTYLGGSGLDPSLAEADTRLRDHSPAALAEEDRWLAETQQAFEAAKGLTSPALRIDRDVALAQIRFLLRQHKVRRYAERSVDTYTDEPFRAIDFALQGMPQTGEGTFGLPEHWQRVAARLRAFGPYFRAVKEQLLAGVRSGNTPDRRMLARHGLRSSASSAKYFRESLPAIATARISGPDKDRLVAEVQKASLAAADAFDDYNRFLAATYFDDAAKGEAGIKPNFAKDAYAPGEAEYEWALKNNLRIDTPAARLYDESWPVTLATRAEMARLARDIGKKRGLSLPDDDGLAVRAVMNELSKDAPKSDKDRVEGYKNAVTRLVDYARRTGLFEVPQDYRLEVADTPEPLRASITAAYYPAPPFKRDGVGRYYVTPTGNDPAALRDSNVHSMADLSAHEGFPGHDWYYKIMTRFRDDIGPARWLTPGAVEDSSSMWVDSMASEGWALYSEALMAEPRPGAPGGFYTPEERLYQLRGQLVRDVRVRVDVGIHTGRLSYDDAVDLFSQTVGFLPGSCRDPEALKNDDKRQSCKAADGAIFRYSKTPTQAITYRLGKEAVLALRREAAQRLGGAFDLQRFHLEFMRQGSIPAGYFRDELLRALGAAR